MSRIPRGTILIVDDDSAVVDSFSRLLTLEGYQVRTAGNAETALQEIETSHPDAILLDLRMPLVDGLALLRQLRTRPHQRTMPIAILTGDYFVEPSLAQQLRGFGAAVYFKPLWREDLIGIAQQLLRDTHKGAA